MKSVILLVALLISAVSFSQSSEKAVIQTAIHCDHCKQCETCGQKFQANMYKIKGVKMYELDESKSTITVYYNPKKTSLEIIKDAISHLGYDADDVKADETAYASLDGCCKKE